MAPNTDIGFNPCINGHWLKSLRKERETKLKNPYIADSNAVFEKPLQRDFPPFGLIILRKVPFDLSGLSGPCY